MTDRDSDSENFSASESDSKLEQTRSWLAGFLHAAWNRELPLQSETSFFILVNVLDFFLTFLLLNFGAIETNPVADFFFRWWGFRGMLTYKLLTVAFVCLLAQYAAHIDISKGRFIMLAGILLVGGVVAYSAWLLYGLLN
jgi:hypothetical protein